MVEGKLRSLRRALDEVDSRGISVKLLILVYPSELKEIAIALDVPKETEEKFSKCATRDMKVKGSSRAYAFEVVYKGEKK